MNNQGSPIPSYGVSLTTTQMVDNINLTTAVQDVPQIQTTVTENGPEITSIIDAPFIQVTSVNGQTGDVTIDASVRQFKSNKRYVQGSLCVHDGSLYIARADFTSGSTFNPADWIQVQGGGGGASVQSDWKSSNPTDPAYIKNKPTTLGQIDNSYVPITEQEKEKLTQTQIYTLQEKSKLHGTEVFTPGEKNKLASMQILTPEEKNKITQTQIYTPAEKTKLSQTEIFTQAEKTKLADLESITSEDKTKLALLQEPYTTMEKTKLANIESGAQKNVQPNWTETDVSSFSYIRNKPENLVQDAHYVHTDNNFTNEIKQKAMKDYILQQPASVTYENVEWDSIVLTNASQVGYGNIGGTNYRIYSKFIEQRINLTGRTVYNIPHGLPSDTFKILQIQCSVALGSEAQYIPLPYIEDNHYLRWGYDDKYFWFFPTYSWGNKSARIYVLYALPK